MRRPIVVGLVLIAAVVAVYGQTARYDFIDAFVDRLYVTDNPHVQAGLTGDNLAWALTTSESFYWHPITWVAHMLDVTLFGLHAGAHHLTNVLLHIINSLLVLAVLYRLTRAWWRSAFVAGVFALHPVCVDAVACIAQRKDLLSTLFWLLTMWAYVAYARRRGPWRYALVAALFALGLTAKPMLVTLPFALLLLDYWPLGRLGPELDGTRHSRPGVWRLVWEKIPLLAIAAAVGVVTFMAAGETGGTCTTSVVPVSDRVANALVSYVRYIGMTFWPAGLGALYPHPSLVGVPPLEPLAVAVAMLLVAAISYVAVVGRRRRPYLLVGWLWYLGTLLPVIGLVMTGHQALADRYLYIPVLGLAVIVAWGAAEWVGAWPYRQRVCALAGAVALVTLAGLSWIQTHYWRDSRTLFERAVAVTENNWPAYNILASDSLARGDHARAVLWLRRVLRVNPNSDDAHYNLGLALAELDEPEAAVRHLKRAAELAPTSPDAPYALGHLLSRQGRPREAVAALRHSLALEPASASAQAAAHYELGLALIRLGDHPQAVHHLNRAMALDPRLQPPPPLLSQVPTPSDPPG